MKAAIPILRIFDEAKAKEHYVGFFGFKIDWEHRFGENFPLYCQISRGECVIHLSEHHGDASPGSALRIETPGLLAYCQELRAKEYKYSRPGDPEETPWGTKEIRIGDPFGNRLVFYENVPCKEPETAG
ncbi:glyoxalase superfamily protein [Luteolibacter sp. Populi]|uniref:glyoxalase superfamily protein n=1 Tax=Luteolibacter sp. Populi TaxID=3230487 RepID=UPI003465ACF2